MQREERFTSEPSSFEPDDAVPVTIELDERSVEAVEHVGKICGVAFDDALKISIDMLLSMSDSELDQLEREAAAGEQGS